MTFDEWYGGKPAFLRGLRDRQQRFVGEVPKNFLGWIDLPRVTSRPYRRRRRGRRRHTPRLRADSRPPQTVEYWLKHHPRLQHQPWKKWHLRDGEKGPMVWETKHIRFFPQEDGLPTVRQHLLIARNVLDPNEVKYFLGHATAETPLMQVVLFAGG